MNMPKHIAANPAHSLKRSERAKKGIETTMEQDRRLASGAFTSKQASMHAVVLLLVLAMNWEGHEDWMKDHPAALELESAV